MRCSPLSPHLQDTTVWEERIQLPLTTHRQVTDVQQARTVLRDLLITYIVRMVHILTTQEPAHVISVLKVITVSEDL